MPYLVSDPDDPPKRGVSLGYLMRGLAGKKVRIKVETDE